MPSLTQLAAIAAVILGAVYVIGVGVALFGAGAAHPIFTLGLLPVAIIVFILGVLILRRGAGDSYDNVEK